MDSLQSWNEFLDSLKKTAADTIAQRPVKSPQDEALIVRNVARMLRQVLDWEMENTDPHLPRFNNWEVLTMTGAPLGPNLDSPYSLIRLDPKATYRLSGSTEGLMDVNVSIRRGFPPNDYGIYGDVGFKDMTVKDGNWELFIAPETIAGKPVLQFPETKPSDIVHMFLRIYWVDWSHYRRPLVEIECLDPPAARQPVPFTPEVLGAQLKSAAENLHFRSLFQHDWFVKFLARDQSKPGNVQGGNSYVNYGAERYEIAADEALLIEFQRPKARYWSMQIYDGIVYDAFDWMRNITIRNHVTSYVPPDDKVQMLVAHHDPGVRNWLDTGGNREGIAFYRWIWAEDVPPVSMRAAKFSDIPKLLHPATPRIAEALRQQELRQHRRKLQHHFCW